MNQSYVVIGTFFELGKKTNNVLGDEKDKSNPDAYFYKSKSVVYYIIRISYNSVKCFMYLH